MKIITLPRVFKGASGAEFNLLPYGKYRKKIRKIQEKNPFFAVLNLFCLLPFLHFGIIIRNMNWKIETCKQFFDCKLK